MGMKLVLVVVVTMVLLQTGFGIDTVSCPACKKFSILNSSTTTVLPDECEADEDHEEQCSLNYKCYHIQIKRTGAWIDHIGCYKPGEVAEDLFNIFDKYARIANIGQKDNLRPVDFVGTDPRKYEYGSFDPASSAGPTTSLPSTTVGLGPTEESPTESESEPVCAAGQYLNPGAKCSECPKGSYTAEANSADGCATCEKDLVGNADSGATACVEREDEEEVEPGSAAGLSATCVLVIMTLSWAFYFYK